MRAERILVIDDEPTVTSLLSRYLEQEGFVCQSASDADEALQYFREDSFSAALVDIRMQGKDGITLLREMKALDPDLATIMVTAVQDRESAVRAMKLGAEDYIVKPFNLDEVLTSLRKALEKRHLTLENRAYHQELERLVAERTRDLARRNRELSGLNALGATLSRSLDLSEVLSLGLDQLLQIIPAEMGGVYLWEGDELRLQAHQGTGVLPSSLDGSKGVAAQARLTHQPVLGAGLDRTLGQPSYLPAAISEAWVPLHKGAEPLGMLIVASNTHSLTEDDFRLLVTIGDQMSVALDNARLYGEMQRQASELRKANIRFSRANRRLRTLREMGASITSTLSLDERLERILHQLAHVVSYDSATIQLLRDGYLEIVAGRGFSEPEAVIGLRFPVAGHHLNMAVIEGRKPVILPNAQVAYPDFREPPHGHIRSWLGVPLVVGHRVIGMVTVDSGEVGYFNEEHVQLISPFVNQAAIAIENARLYQETMAAQQRSDTILSEAFTGIMVVDTNLRLREFNPAAETITGYQASEVLGHPLQQCFGEELYGGGSPLHQAIASGEQILPTETTIAGRRGRRDILLGVTPLPTERPAPTEYLLSFADFTELKEVERLKTNLVANVSHELRSPLSSIRAYTELLMEDLDEGDVEVRQHFLRVIDQETQHLADLITDLLNVARLESGGFEPHMLDVSLRDVAEETLARCQVQAQQRGIELLLEAPSDLPHVLADPEMMGILFKNLVSNSIKFSPQGGDVKVSLQADEEWQTVEVTDEGIGIAPQDLPRIFQKFYRADRTIEAGFEGTGLGLTLVKEVVEVHGGSIEVHSELGKGTRFTIALPMKPSLPGPDGPEMTKAGAQLLKGTDEEEAAHH